MNLTIRANVLQIKQPILMHVCIIFESIVYIKNMKWMLLSHTGPWCKRIVFEAWMCLKPEYLTLYEQLL